MGDVSMLDQIGALRCWFRADSGEWPTSVRMNYDDWDKLMSEAMAWTSCVSYLSRKPTVFGMVPLLDPKWPKGFPACLSAKSAAIAIEEGARSA